MAAFTRVSRADRAASALARWDEQYPRESPRRYVFADYGATAGDIRARLVALGPTPDPAAVDAAIGDTTWTAAECAGCSRNCSAVVAVLIDYLEFDDRASVTDGHVQLCGDCLREALAVLEQRVAG